METRANHILIGAFVLLATVLGFATVYWMNGTGAGRSGKYYEVVFEGPVTGLAGASGVLFNGIKVGQVISLSIDPDDSRKTRALISIDRRVPVRENSQARIQSQGLTGFASLQVSPGSPDAPLLIAAAGARYPVIRAELVSSRSLMEAAPELMGNANALVLRLNKIVEANENMILKAVRNIEAFTAVLDANKDNIGTVMRGAREVTERIGKVAERLDRLVAGNEDKLSRSISNVEQVSGVLAENKENIAAILREARELTQRVSSAALKMDGLISNNQTSIRNTVQNVESFTKVLFDNKESVGVVMRDAQEITAKFKIVADKMERAIDDLSGFAGGGGESFMAQASEAVKSFRSLADKLDRSIGDEAKGIALVARKGLKEFDGFMRDGRRAVRNLDRVLDKIEKNPQSFIFGGKQVREYKSN